MSGTVEQYIELADGERLQMACGYDTDLSLWLWELEPGTYTLSELFSIFTVPQLTRVITSRVGDQTDVWRGFTEFASIQQDRANTIRVRMRKPIT